MTTIAQNKDELHQAITQAFNKIYSDYEAFDLSQTRVLGVQGNIKNTHISVCDSLAYLLGWAKLVLKWLQAYAQNETVVLPARGFGWNELGKLATHFHQQYRAWSYPALLAEFQMYIESVLAQVAELDDSALYGAPWYRHYTLGRMIQLNTSSPMKSMRTKIRRFHAEIRQG